MENYHRQEFLNGYNVILEELYFVFHNSEEFINKYKMKMAYSAAEMNTEEFRKKYQELYNQFLDES